MNSSRENRISKVSCGDFHDACNFTEIGGGAAETTRKRKEI
jgi:hypothetical protein